ncbi:MAG: hypothetical protein GWP08_17185 [Nitrospiraceae bacterium]|nr:hypothetical protein [Nitrospiraceae bacterium]
MIIWAILLFVAGMILILTEFIVPGLICGAIGSVLILISGGLVWYEYPEHALLIVLAYAAAACAITVLGMYLMARTRAASHLILSDSQQADAGYVASESKHANIGDIGSVRTALRPAGTIVIDGKRVDAVANGAFITEGTSVRVIEVRGNRVVVEEAKE